MFHNPRVVAACTGDPQCAALKTRYSWIHGKKMTRALGRGTIVDTGMLALEGREITAAHSLMTCHGDCELAVHDVTAKADEITFHQDTVEAEAHGNMRIAVIPHPSTSEQK